jgi:hypothetical protein
MKLVKLHPIKRANLLADMYQFLNERWGFGKGRVPDTDAVGLALSEVDA